MIIINHIPITLLNSLLPVIWDNTPHQNCAVREITEFDCMMLTSNDSELRFAHVRKQRKTMKLLI